MIVEKKVSSADFIKTEEMLRANCLSSYYLVNTENTKVYLIRKKEAYIFLNLDIPSNYGEVTFADSKEEIAKKVSSWLDEFMSKAEEKEGVYRWLLVEEKEFRKPVRRVFDQSINIFSRKLGS